MTCWGEEAIHVGSAAALMPSECLVVETILQLGLSSYFRYRCATINMRYLPTLCCVMIFATDDEIFAQYREAGVLLWRGFSLQNIMDQVPIRGKHYVLITIATSNILMVMTLVFQ